MRHFTLVIAGGGLAAARTIDAYREAGGGGRLALVAQEPRLPYHRPPLSKRYLRGETDATPYVQDESFYRDRDVELLLGTSVAAVDPNTRTVTLRDGSRLRAQQLVIATGASPRRLHVPGAELRGVFALRTVADSAAIREAARGSSGALVVGGGFIGMEVAASLRQLGLAVTLVHRGRGLFDQFRSPRLSEQLLTLYRQRQVDVLLEQEIARFGGRGRFEWAETASGLRLEADLAVVGVGVVPNVGFLDGTGLAVDDGIVVDERFETTAPGVYAVGDVARFLDPLFGRRRRIEHWSNANYQGTQLGRILAGRPGGYDTVSSFFTEVFGTTIKLFGDTSTFDELVEEGTLEDGFLATFADGGRLVAAITVGQSEELENKVKAVIADGGPASSVREGLAAGSAR